MGTLNWTLGKYAKDDNKNTVSSTVFASSATATNNVSPASITTEAAVGNVFTGTASEDQWISAEGTAAAVGTGHFFPAGVQKSIEIEREGAITAVDAT